MGPVISHQGLRWRMDHSERFTRRSALLLLGVAAMWAAWWTILRVLAVITASPPQVTALIDLIVVLAPTVGALVTLAASLTAQRWSWTEIVADPHGLVLRRPWPRKTRSLAWTEVRRVRVLAQALVVETQRGRIELERGSDPPETVHQVATWLEAGRATGFERPSTPVAPRELERLRTLANHLD